MEKTRQCKLCSEVYPSYYVTLSGVCEDCKEPPETVKGHCVSFRKEDLCRARRRRS